jgi:7-keto-8-aminopelargonate synthetase-like enzyme
MGQLQEKYKHYREPQKFMEADVYPYFRAIEGKQGTEVEMGGHKVLMFGSNAYTGLTGDQRIIDAAKAALDKYGSGCAGSRFLNGTLDIHVQLEKEISEFIHKDDCLCFSTGFSVNQGVNWISKMRQLGVSKREISVRINLYKTHLLEILNRLVDSLVDA